MIFPCILPEPSRILGSFLFASRFALDCNRASRGHCRVDTIRLWAESRLFPPGKPFQRISPDWGGTNRAARSSSKKVRLFAIIKFLLCCKAYITQEATIFFRGLRLGAASPSLVASYPDRQLFPTCFSVFCDSLNRNNSCKYAICISYSIYIPCAEHVLAQNLKGHSSSSDAPVETIQPVGDRQNACLSFS